jgi:hypothetical protein
MSRREEYGRDGMVRTCLALADPTILDDLKADAAVFDEAVDRLRRDGERRVPYRLTGATSRVAHDTSLLAAVREILGQHDVVMWGANIQRQVPNQADRWHADVESWHWPTVTVVVGLDGCDEGSTTRCIPGTQHLRRWPPSTADDATVLRAARRKNDCPEGIVRFDSFGDGRFYLFNARCWHCGHADGAQEKLALFLHYQLARDPRIPRMKNYRHSTWFDEPAPYVAIDGATVNEQQYPPPRRSRAGMLALLGWRRQG